MVKSIFDNGGIIGKTNNPTLGFCSGIWNIQTQSDNASAGNWPYDYSFSYANFASTTGLNLVSTASITSNEIYITNTTANDVGNVYRTTAVPYNRNFSFNWNFECSGGTGADGFCVQWTKTNNTNGALGAALSAIASADTIHALYFRTYATGSPGLAWFKNNVQQGSIQANAISWRQNVFYWLDYNHTNQTCSIFYSTTNSKPGSANHTFNSFVFDTDNYYIGFGAATGGTTDNHRLKSMSMTR